MSALDQKIDDLYRQSLDAFIPARTALAKSLSGADAQRVRRLVKPTVVPWAVNQVYWHARSVYDALVATGARVRKAQIAALEGRAADVRAANDAHRRAIADAVKEALRAADGAGSKPSPDALMRTFEAVSLAASPVDTPGRLTRPLQPSGFEALGGVQVKARPDASTSPGRAAAAKRSAKQEEAARRQAEAAQRKHDAEIKRAEAALERARQRMAKAQATLRETRNREP